MLLSFGRRLRRGFGFRLGLRLRGSTAIFLGLFVALFYMFWWTMLCTAYIMWGCMWLTWQFLRGLWWFCCLPFRALLLLFRKHKRPEA